jgi:hypothetical protein
MTDKPEGPEGGKDTVALSLTREEFVAYLASRTISRSVRWIAALATAIVAVIAFLGYERYSDLVEAAADDVARRVLEEENLGDEARTRLAERINRFVQQREDQFIEMATLEIRGRIQEITVSVLREQSPSPPEAAVIGDQGGTGGWYVVVGADVNRRDSDGTVRDIVREVGPERLQEHFRGLKRCPPTEERSFFILVLGDRFSYDRAVELRDDARQEGFRTDAYVIDGGRSGFVCDGEAVDLARFASQVGQ